MGFKALLCAVLGALIGAAAWGAVTYYTGYEIGYVALGVGFVVGLGAKLGGSHGPAAGAICALLALGSIFAGKMVGVELTRENAVRQSIEEELTPEMFAEMKADSEVLATFTGETAAFMVQRGYTEAESAAEVTPDEIRHFEQYQQPTLEDLQGDPTYSAWLEMTTERMLRDSKEEMSTLSFVKADLGLMDMLFAVLGIGTAYQVAAAGKEE